MSGQSWVVCAGLAALVALSGCADAAPPGADGPGLAITIAALDLAGVGDVVWDLQVVNGASAVVWQRRITSSAYGDSAGSASYIGPCDADPAVADNTVNVWVVGVYAGAVAAADAGSFNAGSTAGAGAVVGTPVLFQNPTTTAPLSREVACRENADLAVRFDVALMRPAQQGFFDIAVNFNDVFCSAKLDCCVEGDDGCEDIRLLFDAGGARARTFVIGLACTGGAVSGVATALYLDPIQLDCDVNSDGATFVADVTIDPAGGGPGNLCTAGDLAACAAVRAQGSADPDAYLFQVAAYRGMEQLVVGAVSAQKVYWNIALGVNAGISACRLRTRATADDAADPADGVSGGIIAAGAVYPYLAWDADLATCAAEPLTFGDAGATVAATYTGTGDAALGFLFQFGGSLPAGCTGTCPASVPPATAFLAQACPSGWADLGPPVAGPGAAYCGAASCVACESPAIAGAIPAASTLVMSVCPAGWTDVGPTGNGPGFVLCPAGSCRRCESPGAPSDVPLGGIFLAAACPTGWADLGAGTGPGSALCPSTQCRWCRAP